jgi:hypothetical protein
MKNFFRSSVVLGSLFSGCLAINPGSIILTLDASSIGEDVRAKLTEVGVFICDEGKGDDCSQATNYEEFSVLSSNRGLKEKETIGLSLRSFVGPIHLRLVAAESDPSFDKANSGTIAQAEAFIQVEARDNLLMPLRLLATPLPVLRLPSTAGLDVVDASTIGCNQDEPFRAVWSEFDGVNSEVQSTSIDLAAKADPAISHLIAPNNIISDIEQAGSADCKTVGVGILAQNLAGDSFGAFAAKLVAGTILPQPYQSSTELLVNMNMGFGEEGFSVSWDANISVDLNQSFVQTTTNLLTLAPLGQPRPLRGNGAPGLAKSSTAGGASGVSVFVDESNQVLALLDLKANRQSALATVKVGGGQRFPFDPQVAFLDDARILTVWFDCEALDCRVVGRITDRLGQDASNDFPGLKDFAEFCTNEIGCFQIAEQQINPFDLALSVGPDGSFVVVWRFQKNSGNADGFELVAAFYGSDGPRLNPFSLAADAAAVSPAGVNISQGNTQIAATPTGDVAISWVETTNISIAPFGLAAKVSVIPVGLPNLAAEKK